MTLRAPEEVTAPRELRVLVLARAGNLRRQLVSALGAVPDVCVLGAYAAGDAALERTRRDAVDVLLVEADADLDSVSRACAGMARPPTWLAVCEGTPDAALTTRAILCGAAGVLPLRAGRDPAEIAAAIRAHSRSAPDSRPEKRRVRSTVPPPATLGNARPPDVIGRFRTATPARRELLAIGCSTGGPPAVTALIRELPSSFRVPITIVQHMAAAHIPYFVEGLSRQLARPVVLATEGTTIEPGSVYVAPGDVHMTIAREGAKLRLRLVDGPPEHNCRPAVDPFFRSLAATCGHLAIGVVLTGMGSDGALGARDLAQAGAPILAQDAGTSVVWGMPGATYQIGAASAVLPLGELPAEIMKWSA